MSDSNSNSSNGGISFVGLLTIALIVLKLTGHIAWTWWWVLSPLWISALVVMTIILFVGLLILFKK